MILEAEQKITEKIDIQHVTFGRDRQWWTVEEFFGILWLGLVGEVITSRIFSSEVLNNVLLIVTIRRISVDSDATST